MAMRRTAAAIALLSAGVWLGTPASVELSQSTAESRGSLIARAQVWRPVDTPALDLKAGPGGPEAFAFHETIPCDYLNKPLAGATRKFACRRSNGDELKVKYPDPNNRSGEVYGEILGTRLLWALGFGADRMYSVRIVCHGCPEAVGGMLRENGDRILDPAAVERKLGDELSGGWSWDELDKVDEAKGGATTAERDALKLLAVLMQHSDSKPENQRIDCLDAKRGHHQRCQQPLLLISDLGVSFGRALALNQERGSVNLKEWAKLPIWKGERGCVGNLAGSWTGTLAYPVIGEAGRRFLAARLMQLSDDQLRELFEAARVSLRPRDAQDGRTGFPAVDEWVSAFKEKRRQIVERRCEAGL
jgi:hypothetical protein